MKNLKYKLETLDQEIHEKYLKIEEEEIEFKIYEWVHQNFHADEIILHMLNTHEAILVDNNNHSMFIKYENGEIILDYDPLNPGKYHE